MKKRLISLLLTLVMLVSLCPALAATASADAQVTTVTLNSGDTVLKLCQNIGVDYYAHKNLIMSLNGFTSEAQFSNMAVGAKVVLPVSNAAAANLSSSGVGAATTTTAPVANTVVGATSSVTGTTTSIPTGDYASYYLVGYTIQPGETISGIYNNWGLSYKTYSNQILKLNRLGNFNAIPAGKTLVLPTTNPAIAGSNYTTVMAHVMRAGDSAYNIICTNYGLNYNSVQAQVQALNNRENLGNFMVGEVLYIPVNGLVSSNTTVTPGTGSSSSSAIINGSAAYNLVSQTPSNGNFALIVDGSAAAAAVAGKTVEIVATPNTGYAVSQISVTKVGDPNTAVAVQGNKFVMPAYSVSVSVAFSQAIVSNIKLDATSNGSVSAMVNSAVVTSATAGNLVTVKTIPATGFMLDTIRVTYNEYRDTVAVENGQFIMPTFPVTVSATFKTDPNFDPTRGHNIYVDAANAKVVTKLGDTEVTTAKAGDRLSLNITPDTNYTVQNLVVYYDDFKKTVDVEKNAFTMPDGPVTIVATVKPTASAVFGITKVVNQDGNVSVTVNGQEASSANVGATVKITGSSNKAYYNYVPAVFKTGDTSTTVPVAADGTFIMPDFPVTVNVKFYVYHDIKLDVSNGNKGWFNVTAAMTGGAISKAGAGVELKVNVWGYNQNTHVPGDIIVTFADGSVHTFTGTSFIMPDCDIRVRVNFNPIQFITVHEAIPLNPDGNRTSNAGNSFTINGVYVDDLGRFTKSLAAGKSNTVVINPAPALGFGLFSIEYRYYDTNNNVVTGSVGKNPITGKYQFEMPELKAGTSFEMWVYFKQIRSYNIALNYDGSKGTVTTLTSIGVVNAAVENTKVSMLFACKPGYSVDMANLEVVKSDGSLVNINKNDNTFFMPASDVTINVPFKSELNKIIVSPIPYSDDNTTHKGMLNVLVNGTKYTESQLTYERALPDLVKAGSIVTVINESSHGYILDTTTPINITSPDGSIAYETVDRDKFTFVMPNADVTITARYADDMYNIVAVGSDKGSFDVPKQGNRNEPVKVSNIVPNPGYELDKILVTYTDSDGILRKNVDITATAEFTPLGLNIPQSDVVIEVTFKPALNPISIKYIYDDTHNPTMNYAVDLYIDGVLVENIVRNTANGVDILDAANGLPTGATVVIKRQEHNQDSNFLIKNMWIMHNGNAIQPEYANNQYYFTVPYVDSKLPADLVLNVQYGTENGQDFRLEAIKTSESKGNAGVAIEIDGKTGTMAQPNEPLKITFTPDTGYVVNKVTITYQNSDGVTVPTEYVNINNVLEIASGTGHPVPTLPKNGIAYINYTVEPLEYTVYYNENVSGAGTACTFTVDGNPIGTTVPYGSTVVAKPDGGANYSATAVKVNGIDAVNNSDGTWSFTMPNAHAEVIASYTASGFTLTSKIEGSGTGTVQYKVGETVYNDGASIPHGSQVIIIATPAAGSAFNGIVFNGTAASKDANGNYYITMPNKNSEVVVGFVAANYDITYAYAEGSANPDSFDINGSANPTTAFASPIKINVAGNYALESVVASYKGHDGSSVADTLDIVKAEDGSYSVNLKTMPQNGEKVLLTLKFSVVPVYFDLLDVSGVAEEDAVLKFYDSEDSDRKEIEKAVAGSKVYGEITVAYNKTVENNQIKWYGSNTEDLSFHSISSDGKTAAYRFDFEMPNDGVIVEYKVIGKSAINVYSADGRATVPAAAWYNTDFNVTILPPANGEQVYRCYAVYKDADGVSKEEECSVVGTDIIFKIPSLPIHSNDRLNSVAIYVTYMNEVSNP